MEDLTFFSLFSRFSAVGLYSLLRRGRDTRALSPPPHEHRGKAVPGHSEKAVVCDSHREALPETTSSGTLILDFQPPEL